MKLFPFLQTIASIALCAQVSMLTPCSRSVGILRRALSTPLLLIQLGILGSIGLAYAQVYPCDGSIADRIVQRQLRAAPGFIKEKGEIEHDKWNSTSNHSDLTSREEWLDLIGYHTRYEFRINVSNENFTDYLLCLDAMKTTDGSLQYYVVDGRLMILLSPSEQGQWAQQSMKCNQRIDADYLASEFVSVTNVVGDDLKPLCNCADDDAEVLPNLIKLSDDEIASTRLEKRGHDIEILFTGGKHDYNCKGDRDACISTKYGNKISKGRVMVDDVNYSAIWSNHYCRYTCGENDYAGIMVDTYDKWYPNYFPNGKLHYSGAMTYENNGPFWNPEDMRQRKCGAWDVPGGLGWTPEDL